MRGRRAGVGAEVTPLVYYFGAWGGLGHCLWNPDGQPDLVAAKRLPWRDIDGALAGDPALMDPRMPLHWSIAHQSEGRVRLHRRDGWTAIAFWDRSCDCRGGSNSALFAKGDFTGKEMLTLFERTFPAVWRRITSRFQLVLPDEAAS